MSVTDYLPRFEDHFPKTRRGHGSTHPEVQYDPKTGIKTREACRCVEPTCQLNMPKSSNAHEDRAANVEEWRKERGL